MSQASRVLSLTRTGRVSRLPSVSDYVALTKPRVMSLVLFTALVGISVAPGHLDRGLGIIALICIAAGAGGAAALNMWYDADIDALMTRTAKRPIPSGRVSPAEALTFGLLLSAGAIVTLGVMLNTEAAALLCFTVFFYVVIYTMWLKRRTPQNIVIGGAAGAFPPMVGWVAVTGHLGVEPMVLFLIIFLWTPVHFWALALNHAGEYARAGVPMLPVVAGRAETKKQMLIYSLILLPISVMPRVLGFAGTLYSAVAVGAGAALIVFVLRLRASTGGQEARIASRLFAFSIAYLFILFALLLIDAVVIHGQSA